MLQYFLSGTVLGFSAGVAPGPLQALVISETLRHNRKEGIRVALVPLLTDLPIILVSLILLKELSRFKPILGLISLAGAVFVLYLAVESFRANSVELTLQETRPKSIQKGVIANFLNPHPYLFWITVGTPIILKAGNVNVLAAVVFVGSFYMLLVGSKILLAMVIGKYQAFLRGKIYQYIMRCLGFALILIALLLLRDGLSLSGIL
ncbi:MAG: LysE family translocator [Calditrichota bacterium]